MDPVQHKPIYHYNTPLKQVSRILKLQNYEVADMERHNIFTLGQLCASNRIEYKDDAKAAESLITKDGAEVNKKSSGAVPVWTLVHKCWMKEGSAIELQQQVVDAYLIKFTSFSQNSQHVDVLLQMLPDDMNKDLCDLISRYGQQSDKQFSEMVHVYVDFNRLKEQVTTGCRLLDHSMLFSLFIVSTKSQNTRSRDRYCVDYRSRYKRKHEVVNEQDVGQFLLNHDPVFVSSTLKPNLDFPSLQNLLKLEMHPYQIQSVQWMNQVEEIVANSTGFVLLENHQDTDSVALWPGTPCQLWFDRRSGHIYTEVDGGTQDAGHRMFSKGGILADEMGLGKTLQCLTLIRSNQRNVPDYIAQLGRVQRPNATFRYQCKATLIVLPSHIVRQWEKELVAISNEKLQIVTISTKTKHQKITYADILRADIVLVQANYIGSYWPDVAKLTNSRQITDRSVAKDMEAVFLERQRGVANPMQYPMPYLEHFDWARIIVDEAHEHSNVKQYANGRCLISKLFTQLQEFKSVTRWYVTGTPLPHGMHSVRGLCHFLQITTDVPGVSGQQMFDNDHGTAVLDSIHRWLFCRRTKDSVKDRFQLPALKHEMVCYQINDLERYIYNLTTPDAKTSHNPAAAVASILHDQYGSKVAMDQAEVREHVRMELLRARDIENDRLVSKQQSLAHAHAQNNNIWTVAIQRDIQYITGYLFPWYDRHIQQIPQVSTTSCSETCLHCQVCQTNKRPDLWTTACGHTLCFTCKQHTLDNLNTCPVCEVRAATAAILSHENGVFMENSELNAGIRFEFGSRISTFVAWYRKLIHQHNTVAPKCLVFVHNAVLLEVLAKCLNSEKIASRKCKGNTLIVNKALDMFRTDKTLSVMLMPLTSKSSGVHITEATHVVFFDNCDHDVSPAVALEAQAVGRAYRQGQQQHVTVVRFAAIGTKDFVTSQRNTESLAPTLRGEKISPHDLGTENELSSTTKLGRFGKSDNIVRYLPHIGFEHGNDYYSLDQTLYKT